MPCRPRAAPAGAGWRRVPGPPCDRDGHWPPESRTPTPTRSHRAHAAARRAGARPCRPPARPRTDCDLEDLSRRYPPPGMHAGVCPSLASPGNCDGLTLSVAGQRDVHGGLGMGGGRVDDRYWAVLGWDVGRTSAAAKKCYRTGWRITRSLAGRSGHGNLVDSPLVT